MLCFKETQHAYVVACQTPAKRKPTASLRNHQAEQSSHRDVKGGCRNATFTETQKPEVEKPEEEQPKKTGRREKTEAPSSENAP